MTLRPQRWHARLQYRPPPACQGATCEVPHLLATLDPAADGGGLTLGLVEPPGLHFPTYGTDRLLTATRVSSWGDANTVAASLHYALEPTGLTPEQRQYLAIVVERPKKRRDQRAKHRSLGLLIDVLAAFKRVARPATWTAHFPETWKANVPKEIHHRRALAALRDDDGDTDDLTALDPDSPDYQHDTADAIALWMWAVGRIGRGGVVGRYHETR